MSNSSEHHLSAVDYAVLDCEWVAYVRVKHFGVQLTIGFGIHQGIGNANLAARALQTAFQNQSHAEIFARLFDAGHTLAADLAGGNNLQWIASGELSKFGGKGLSQAVTKGDAAGVVGGGSKRQNRQLHRCGRTDRTQSGQIHARPLQSVTRPEVDTGGKERNRDQGRHPEPGLSLPSLLAI